MKVIRGIKELQIVFLLIHARRIDNLNRVAEASLINTIDLSHEIHI